MKDTSTRARNLRNDPPTDFNRGKRIRHFWNFSLAYWIELREDVVDGVLGANKQHEPLILLEGYYL